MQFTPHVLINKGATWQNSTAEQLGDAEFPFEDANQAFLATCETAYSPAGCCIKKNYKWKSALFDWMFECWFFPLIQEAVCFLFTGDLLCTDQSARGSRSSVLAGPSVPEAPSHTAWMHDTSIGCSPSDVLHLMFLSVYRRKKLGSMSVWCSFTNMSMNSVDTVI